MSKFTDKNKYTTTQVESFVRTIEHNIGIFKNEVEGHIRKEVTLVIGSSGMGKSTIMNMLAGQAMEVSDLDGEWLIDVSKARDSEGNIIIDPAGNPIQNYAGEIKTDGFGVIKIGHDGDAETKFPNYVFTANTQFWDCPGFGDTRGPDVEISNMYYINHLLNGVPTSVMSEDIPLSINNNVCNVKFIIVQSSASTSEGGGVLFRETIGNLCKMFPTQNVESLINASTFVFTKVSAQEFRNEKYLTNILKNKVAMGTDEKVIEFLQVMKDNSEQIKHVKIPKVNSTGDNFDTILSVVNSITEKTSETTYITGNNVIGFSISAEAQVIALEFEQFLQSELNRDCINLTSMLQEVLGEIQTNYGIARAKQEILTLLELSKLDKTHIQQAIEVGGYNTLSIHLIEQLDKLPNNNPNYNPLLNKISNNLKFIPFISNINHFGQVSDEYFDSFIESVESVGEEFLSTAEVEAMRAQCQELKNDITEYVPTWMVTGAAALGGLACIGSGIAVIIINKNPQAATGLLTTGTGLLSLAIAGTASGSKPAKAVAKESATEQTKSKNEIPEKSEAKAKTGEDSLSTLVDTAKEVWATGKKVIEAGPIISSTLTEAMNLLGHHEEYIDSQDA